jgi:hypothetical protein
MRGFAISLRRAVFLALAIGLSLAAIIAIVAVLSRRFDGLDARLVATSLGFSLFTALGAAGVGARRAGARVRVLGALTMGAAGASFATFLVALWMDAGWAVRPCVTLSTLTLGAAHACLVQMGRRDADTPLIDRLALASIATGSLDALLLVAAVNGAFEHIDGNEVRLSAVLVIVLLTTSLLPPVLRRAGVRAPVHTAGPADSLSACSGHSSVASPGELLTIAHRLEALAPAAGEVSASMRTTAAHLRRLANRATS